MRTLKDYTMLIAKGAGMGAADVIPGVSGGTIAFMTGIFEELVASINSLDAKAISLLLSGNIKALWKHINGGFLIAVGSGILLSVITLAKFMLYMLTHHPIETWAFFFGLIIASSMFILRGIKEWNIVSVLMTIAGIILGITVCTLSPTETPNDLWFIFLSGALAICAMILPGISGSFILLILGKYQYIMSAITSCVSNVGALWGSAGADSALFWQSAAVLAVFLIGAAVGILGFSKFLHWLLARWNKETLIVLAGFIIGSLVKVWPWSNTEAIVNAQFPGVAALSDVLSAAMESGVGVQVAQGAYDMAVAEYAPLIDMQIGSALIFALIGFGLVTGIEHVGKLMKK